MRLVSAFGFGALFAVGLGLSQMTWPTRVIGFLDFFGEWDPTLISVMIGAVASYTFFYRVVRGHSPVLAAGFQLPSARRLDPRLIAGAAMFGVGWAIAGFCPGPAITSLASGMFEPMLFVVAMIAGMVLFELWNRRSA